MFETDDPAILKLIESFPPQCREILKDIKFDVRIDLESFTEQPYVVTAVDELALAGMTTADAADAVIRITKKAQDEVFDRVGLDGKLQLTIWVLRGYFKSTPIPIELVGVIEEKLRMGSNNG